MLLAFFTTADFLRAALAAEILLQSREIARQNDSSTSSGMTNALQIPPRSGTAHGSAQTDAFLLAGELQAPVIPIAVEMHQHLRRDAGAILDCPIFLTSGSPVRTGDSSRRRDCSCRIVCAPRRPASGVRGGGNGGHRLGHASGRKMTID